ncbi:(Fe-S)-binding protein [Brevibacillus parabrevis]|uniref:Glycolate oxidase iron-sulfur subunit n=1 Tax=Brevibacillus parabrevis TaxID=54914 RepID=A0A4Y3P8M2_BREPA|nr:(Fe-S)-binding protein [Brevibacillus parabrevis]RNB96792.1 (Fe-S)-binding protein [Brevibacillus parabrevis]GEB30800.1 putative glycolate oxidase iron-sulfur subunit [Brevibacillus parabrevis]
MLKEALVKKLDYEELSNCMRCGFCQPACPTFRETGYEAASPRGRIALMKAVADGVMEPDKDFVDQMNLCLGCRACEPVCPAGVSYGQLIEQTREAIEDVQQHPWWVKAVRRLAFVHLFPEQKRLQQLGRLLRFYQRSGLQKAVRKLGLLFWLPRHLREMEAIMPEASARSLADEWQAAVIPAIGERKYRVGMFSGCIMDVLFQETNRNTVRLLAEAGCEVVIVPGQVCCGALHAHSGERGIARKLARINVAVFHEANVDMIISNAGGCGAMLKEYDHLLADDAEMREQADWFAARVKDISEVLGEQMDAQKWQSLPQRITYQSSCHLRNGMKVSNEPVQLVKNIPGATYVPLFEGERCCGSAGIYNLLQPEMASGLLDEKMGHVAKTQADILVTSNPGCLLQMKAGIHRAGLDGRMEAVHLVDLLARVSPKE